MKRVNHLKIPTSGVWMDFVDRAYAVCATGRRHTVDISAPIYRDSRARARAIVAAGERMNDCLVPRPAGFGQLVHHSAAAFTAT